MRDTVQTAATPMETFETNQTPLPQFSGAAKVWLHAAPNAPHRLDIFSLNEDNFALKSIRLLLEQRPFDLDFQASYPANVHLNHFYFEARNREKIFGSSNFGIGFPMIYSELNDESLVAPLFLWRLRLDADAQHIDSWKITQSKDSYAIPNYPLFQLIDALHGTEFTHRAKRMVHENQLHTSSLKELTDGLSLVLGLKEGGFALGVTASPGKREIEDLQKAKTLHWSAIIGLLPVVPHDLETQSPIIMPDLEGGLDWDHTLSVFPMDPSQREALISAQNNTLTIVEGASGSGKTYTIANSIINALSNGCKCMVVSNSINTLKRCQNYLLQGGFGDLSFLIRDIDTDKMMLLDMLRAATDTKTNYTYDKDTYRTVITKTIREQNILDKAWRALHAPIFGDWDFTDVTGHFLRANRSTGKEILASQLNPTDFKYTKEEYDTIRANIKSSEPLFRKFSNLNHPLSKLEGTLFLNRAGGSAKENVQDLLKNLGNTATSLHHRYISASSDYSEMLSDHYEHHFEELYVKVRSIINQIEDGINNYGTDYQRGASALEGLYGVFSEKYKLIALTKETVGKDIFELQKMHSTRKHFEFDFPKVFDIKSTKKVSKIAHDFEAALLDWRGRIPAIVREDVRRLNAKNARHIVDFKEPAEALEKDFDAFLQKSNQSGLYADAFTTDLMTIPQKQAFLEEVIAKIENTNFYMRDFDDFYGWQAHWLSLDSASQKVVAALGKMKPNNWMAAFESWYLHSLLQESYSADMLWQDDSLKMWSRGMDKIKQLLPLQISDQWQNRKKNALKEFRAVNPLKYNRWFGKKNRSLAQNHSVMELVEDHIHSLTETLPVLLVTPQVASDVMRKSDMLFDLVLVDEAHNIPKQECFHLFDRAKNIVVYGDEKQDMTPFEEDDFLEFCKKEGAKTVHLEYQHQPIPEEWIRFNQTAFDTPFKRLPSRFSAKDVSTVLHLDGHYNEESRTNEAEARQIIQWLNDIEPNIDKMFPSIGIACATTEQRDYIAGQLLKIIQRKSAGFEKLLQLQHNGLGVYQFGELQGHHVDVLILSLTHGTVDGKGKMTSDFGFWDTHLGMNQLHVAMTRSSAKMYIAHSIPTTLWNTLSEQKDKKGACILGHLARFGAAIQNDKQEEATSMIESMRKHLGNHKIFFPSNVFMEEVEIALQPYFEPGQIKRDASIAGVTVPLLIRNEVEEKQEDYVLLFDGVLAKSPYPSYEWEEKLAAYLDLHGIHTIPTLSLKWWKSPKQEARKLAGRILGHK